MITLEELYEDFKEESLNRKARSLTEHKEAYSSNTPHHAVDFLSEPIDLNNPVKWMRMAKTVPEAAEKYRRKPKKGAFGRFAFGPNLELEVDTGKDVVLFADGSAQISFVQTDRYFETIDRYEAAIAQLGDLAAAVSSAEKEAEADAKAEEFDAEGVYDVAKGTGNKVALKNQEQAIAKKRSLWVAGLSKRVKAAVQAAREHVEKQRNAALV